MTTPTNRQSFARVGTAPAHRPVPRGNVFVAKLRAADRRAARLGLRPVRLRGRRFAPAIRDALQMT